MVHPMLRRTFWLTLANLTMRFVSMLFQIYLTDQVGAAGVGLLQLILTVDAFAVTVGTSGIRVAAMYLTAEEYGNRRPAGVRSAVLWCLGTGLILSTAVGLLMTFCAPLLAAFWVKDLRAIHSLRLLGLTLPITCLSCILSGYFTACGQIKRLAFVEIGDRILSVLLTVWLLGRGIRGDCAHACSAIVAGGALSSLASGAVLLYFLFRDLRTCPPPEEPLHMGKRLVRFCVPVALNDYLRSGLGTLEQFLIPYGLTRSGGSRSRALADYGTIQGMVFPVLMFCSTVLFAVSDLLVPELARSRAAHDLHRIRSIAGTCLHLGSIFAAAVGGMIFLFAKPLGLLLYKSAEAGYYLRLFAPMLPVLYLDCIVDGMHKGLGEQVYCVRVNTLTNFLDVILLFFLLPRYGIGGYLFTFVFTHSINFYLSIRRLMKVSKFTPKLYRLTVTALCVVFSVLITGLVAPQAPIWSCVIVGAVFYLAQLGLLLLVSKQL